MLIIIIIILKFTYTLFYNVRILNTTYPGPLVPLHFHDHLIDSVLKINLQAIKPKLLWMSHKTSEAAIYYIALKAEHVWDSVGEAWQWPAGYMRNQETSINEREQRRDVLADRAFHPLNPSTSHPLTIHLTSTAHNGTATTLHHVWMLFDSRFQLQMWHLSTCSFNECS